MAREAGFNVTIKAFVPSPKDDFAKQAAAATLMDAVTKGKTLTPEFLQLAKVVEVKAKFGSAAEAE